jgi:hypothetical protein
MLQMKVPYVIKRCTVTAKRIFCPTFYKPQKPGKPAFACCKRDVLCYSKTHLFSGFSYAAKAEKTSACLLQTRCALLYGGLLLAVIDLCHSNADLNMARDPSSAPVCWQSPDIAKGIFFPDFYKPEKPAFACCNRGMLCDSAWPFNCQSDPFYGTYFNIAMIEARRNVFGNSSFMQNECKNFCRQSTSPNTRCVTECQEKNKRCIRQIANNKAIDYSFSRFHHFATNAALCDEQTLGMLRNSNDPYAHVFSALLTSNSSEREMHLTAAAQQGNQPGDFIKCYDEVVVATRNQSSKTIANFFENVDDTCSSMMPENDVAPALVTDISPREAVYDVACEIEKTDKKASVACYERAAVLGFSEASLRLARAYKKGELGLAKDEQKEEHYLTLAIHQGSDTAAELLRDAGKQALAEQAAARRDEVVKEIEELQKNSNDADLKLLLEATDIGISGADVDVVLALQKGLGDISVILFKYNAFIAQYSLKKNDTSFVIPFLKMYTDNLKQAAAQDSNEAAKLLLMRDMWGKLMRIHPNKRMRAECFDQVVKLCSAQDLIDYGNKIKKETPSEQLLIAKYYKSAAGIGGANEKEFFSGFLQETKKHIFETSKTAVTDWNNFLSSLLSIDDITSNDLGATIERKGREVRICHEIMPDEKPVAMAYERCLYSGRGMEIDEAAAFDLCWNMACERNVADSENLYDKVDCAIRLLDRNTGRDVLDAATFFQQVANYYARLGDVANDGMFARVAMALRKQKKFGLAIKSGKDFKGILKFAVENNIPHVMYRTFDQLYNRRGVLEQLEMFAGGLWTWLGKSQRFVADEAAGGSARAEGLLASTLSDDTI